MKDQPYTIPIIFIIIALIRKGCTSGDLFQFRCPDQSVQSVHEHSRHPDPNGEDNIHTPQHELQIITCIFCDENGSYSNPKIVAHQIASSSTSASRGKLGGMVAATEVSLTPTLSPAKGFPFILLNKITIQSIISQAGDCGRALWQLVQPVLH